MKNEWRLLTEGIMKCFKEKKTLEMAFEIWGGLGHLGMWGKRFQGQRTR